MLHILDIRYPSSKLDDIDRDCVFPHATSIIIMRRDAFYFRNMEIKINRNDNIVGQCDRNGMSRGLKDKTNVEISRV